MPTIEKILVPTDFSECSMAALDQAALLAGALGASLDVLHVWEIPVFLPPDLRVSDAGAQASLMDMVSRRAEKQLAELVADAGRRGIAVNSAQAKPGIPHATIVDVAKAGDYDLIVIGTHGRTGLSRVLVGSVAERVVRHATCAVMVARLAPSETKVSGEAPVMRSAP